VSAFTAPRAIPVLEEAAEVSYPTQLRRSPHERVTAAGSAS